MGTEVAVAQSNLPAHLQQAQAVDKEFSGGVQSGFPVVSYRGKVWRVKQGGEEQVYVDADGNAIQAIEIILIRSNPALSKTFYEGKYSEGDSGKPRCWSSDGVRPDTDVPNPVNALCDACPMNQWGSRTSDEGKKMKACQDVRRVAIAFGHEIEAYVRGEKKLEDIPVMLLRVPPASLNPLKDYAERILAPKGASPFMLVTKIKFDTDASYPKLVFEGLRWLSEPEFGAVSELRDSEAVKRVIDTSAEHVDAGSTDDGSEEASSEVQAKAEAPESAPAETFSTPVEEPAPEIAPAPAAPAASAAPATVPATAPATAPAPAPEPARAAAVEEAAAATIAQPPQPTAEAPAAAPAETEAAPATSPAGDADVDAMLSSILD